MKFLKGTYLKISAFMIGLLTLSTGWAQSNTLAPNLQELLNHQTRPTIGQLYEALGGGQLADKNPFTYIPVSQAGVDQMTTIKKQLPMIIVQLEKAFPGAIYAGIGRDSALLTDALDAFYRSIGQPGRVVHVDISQSSLEGATPQMIFDYINQLPGVDLSKIEYSHGLIFFDGTHFDEGTQGRQLMSALYSKLSERLVPADLIRRLNFVSTAYDGSAYYPRNLIRNTDVENFLAEQEAKADTKGPQQILSLDAWYTTHGWAWHEMFKKFEYGTDGKIISPPGERLEQREEVLGSMYEVLKIVQDPQFTEQVKQLATQMNVELSSHRERFFYSQKMKFYDELRRLGDWSGLLAQFAEFQKDKVAGEFVAWLRAFPLNDKIEILRKLREADLKRPGAPFQLRSLMLFFKEQKMLSEYEIPEFTLRYMKESQNENKMEILNEYLYFSRHPSVTNPNADHKQRLPKALEDLLLISGRAEAEWLFQHSGSHFFNELESEGKLNEFFKKISPRVILESISRTDFWATDWKNFSENAFLNFIQNIQPQIDVFLEKQWFSLSAQQRMICFEQFLKIDKYKRYTDFTRLLPDPENPHLYLDKIHQMFSSLGRWQLDQFELERLGQKSILFQPMLLRQISTRGLYTKGNSRDESFYEWLSQKKIARILGPKLFEIFKKGQSGSDLWKAELSRRNEELQKVKPATWIVHEKAGSSFTETGGRVTGWQLIDFDLLVVETESGPISISFKTIAEMENFIKYTAALGASFALRIEGPFEQIRSFTTLAQERRVGRQLQFPKVLAAQEIGFRHDGSSSGPNGQLAGPVDTYWKDVSEQLERGRRPWELFTSKERVAEKRAQRIVSKAKACALSTSH